MIQIVSKYGKLKGQGRLLIFDKNGELKLSGVGLSVSWGSIIGTLADQLDLIAALNSKQDTLVDGVNIKTINSQSIQGPGDLIINSSSNGYFPQGW